MPKYLELRRQTWFVSVEVPPSLRPVLGRRLKKTTGTRDLQLAEARKWAIVAELKGQIARVKSGATTLTDEALQFRKEFLAAKTEDDREGVLWAIDDRASQLRGDPLSEQTDFRGRYQYDPAREKAAGQFYGMATASLTPLKTHMEAWIAESHVQARTAADHRRAIGRLQGWGIETIEAVDRKKAGEYVTYLLNHRAPGWSGDRKTITKYLSSLSSYWRWLIQKGHANENPWINQAPPKAKAHLKGQDEQERPFTDDEVKTLLEGPADGLLSDLMRIGALSGMRIDEICDLRVKDCANGALRVTKAKSPAGVRSVPIHLALTEIIKARCEGKEPDDYLIHEMPDVPEGVARERSMPASKRFTRYRKRVGVDEVIPGKRRSLVNFHSFRRWFITKAERAGQDPHIIEAVVGHKRPGMTLGRYSGGPSFHEQMRACVEAVKLP